MIENVFYFDHYWAAEEVSCFWPLLASEPNMIGPVRGHPEVVGTDPSLFYVAVRTLVPLAMPEGCLSVEPQVAISLLGVWA